MWFLFKCSGSPETSRCHLESKEGEKKSTFWNNFHYKQIIKIAKYMLMKLLTEDPLKVEWQERLFWGRHRTLTGQEKIFQHNIERRTTEQHCHLTWIFFWVLVYACPHPCLILILPQSLFCVGCCKVRSHEAQLKINRQSVMGGRRQHDRF